jgi:hypothetical protein
MGEATRWVSVTAGTTGVLEAVDACRREAGALAPDLDDVTVSVTQDGDAGGWRIHAEWFPEQRGPID